MSLVIDTELTRYKWRGADGTVPDYEKLVPTEANTVAHFDTVEASKAIASLKALADSKAYPIDLTLDGGYIVMSSPDDKGHTTIPADIEGGAIKVRLEGGYLTEALKACGGMVDLKLSNANSPTLFAVDGYQLVVMPMLTGESRKAEAEPKAEAVVEPTGAVAEAEAIAITVAEAEAEPETTEAKPKRSRKRDKVAVA